MPIGEAGKGEEDQRLGRVAEQQIDRDRPQRIASIGSRSSSPAMRSGARRPARGSSFGPSRAKALAGPAPATGLAARRQRACASPSDGWAVDRTVFHPAIVATAAAPPYRGNDPNRRATPRRCLGDRTASDNGGAETAELVGCAHPAAEMRAAACHGQRGSNRIVRASAIRSGIAGAGYRSPNRIGDHADRQYRCPRPASSRGRAGSGLPDRTSNT